MTMSNLAALLEELEAGVPANADTLENAGDLIAARESPLTEDELETLLGPASRLHRGNRKRLRLVRFCDNSSADFRLFRVR